MIRFTAPDYVIDDINEHTGIQIVENENGILLTNNEAKIIYNHIREKYPELEIGNDFLMKDVVVIEKICNYKYYIDVFLSDGQCLIIDPEVWGFPYFGKISEHDALEYVHSRTLLDVDYYPRELLQEMRANGWIE